MRTPADDGRGRREGSAPAPGTSRPTASGPAAGTPGSLGIFAVEGNDQLHQVRWRLPLFPYVSITITPLAGRPSDIAVEAPDVAAS